MIRNLKALGVALVAVFALSAVVASAASAQGKLTSDGPVTLTGTETGVGTNFLKAFGLKVECPGSTYTGHKILTVKETEEGKKHVLIPSGETEVTLTPTFVNCKVPGQTWTVTVTMNGCDFQALIGPNKGPDTYAPSASLKCPTVGGVKQEVTLEFWTNGVLHTSTPFCVVHFGETGNQNRTGAHLTDTTQGGVANDIDLNGVFTNISATRTASASHPLLCPETSTATAELSVDLTIKGHNSLKEPTGVGLSG